MDKKKRGRPAGSKNKAKLPPVEIPEEPVYEPVDVFVLPGSAEGETEGVAEGAEPEPWGAHPRPKPAREFVMEMIEDMRRNPNPPPPVKEPPKKPEKRNPKRESIIECLREYQKQFPALRETPIDFDGASDDELLKTRNKFKAMVDQSFSVGDILKHGYCTAISSIEPTLVNRGIRVGGLSCHLSNSGTEAGRHVDIAFRQLAAELKLNDVNIRPELRILGVTLFAGQHLHSQRAADAREAELKGAKEIIEKKADLEFQKQFEDL